MPAATPPAAPPELGCRLIIGGKHKATVRFVGEVDGQQGVWVGLEWDDASRGKHSGLHEGRRYFECLHAPGSGSFVRLAKLLASADAGQTVGQAAAGRYLDAARDGGDTSEEMYLTTASQRRVEIELVGGDKAVAALTAGGHLHLATLADSRISRVGSLGEAAALLWQLSEMDLSDNLIYDWGFVLELAAALPGLSALNLSMNRLHAPSIYAAAPAQQQATNLRTLVLNSCGISWQQAVAACASLPCLTELKLCGNGIRSLQSSAGSVPAGGSVPAALAQLHVLDLENNALEDWDEVACLRSLPSLQSLLLSGNRLQTISYPGGFATLSCLLLGDNALADWRSVDALAHFPLLHEARLSDNPLTQSDPAAARYETVARVSSLTSLNASVVGRAERWDAELNYLRQVTNELAAAAAGDGGGGEADSAVAAVRVAHPRLAELSAKFGPLAPAAPAPDSGSALARNMAELVLRLGDREVRKKVPLSLTVGKLKLLIERLLRVKAAQQALILVRGAGNASLAGGDQLVEPEDITHDDARELRYYAITDGCCVEVVESDPQARAAAVQQAKEAAAALQDLRMEQHEQGLQRLHAEETRLMTA